MTTRQQNAARPAKTLTPPGDTTRTGAKPTENTERERNHANVVRKRWKARIILPIQDGCAMVISDQHYHPEEPASTAHRGALRLVKLLKPFALINNGDTIDGASISRWPVSSFTEMRGRPSVAAEIGTAAARLAEFQKLSIPWLVWNMGNHDARFETRLAEKVPEYAGVDGFTLKEHFPGWLPAWRTDFCAAPDGVPTVIVKHRMKGGAYAAYNNALQAGVSVVTGHDHMLWAKPVSDVRGIRWGIDAGTLADTDSKHFTAYTEDNVVNWQSGFVLLHFRGGVFTGPELVPAIDNEIYFRGDRIGV